jgi:hypothetical protein
VDIVVKRGNHNAAHLGALTALFFCLDGHRIISGFHQFMHCNKD